jgi:glycosyltransferase involved in cell wall biosynthesis
MHSPKISIVTATYNSSHLLSYAIQSIINSSFHDWELIVVGECCSDDTEAVVKDFNDDRISFFNLEKNSGQQAKPNNIGISKAKGEYLAFLNQDDLFFPDHLENCIHEIKDSKADFLIIPGIKILPPGPNGFDPKQIKTDISSVHPDGKFSTNVFSVASTWFLKRSVTEKIGQWKMEKDLYYTPSQEWIFRAFQKGIKFHFPSRVGVMIILSGERMNSYKKKFSPEHAYFSPRLNDPDLKAQMLEQAAIFGYKKFQEHLFFQPKVLVKRVIGLPLDFILKKLNIHPSSYRFKKRWKKKGKLIEKVRKDTGLPSS